MSNVVFFHCKITVIYSTVQQCIVVYSLHTVQYSTIQSGSDHGRDQLHNLLAPNEVTHSSILFGIALFAKVVDMESVDVTLFPKDQNKSLEMTIPNELLVFMEHMKMTVEKISKEINRQQRRYQERL